VSGQPVEAAFADIVRGLIMPGLRVSRELKIGDIDPRPVRENCFIISDKARALGNAVLEAILYLKNSNDDRR